MSKFSHAYKELTYNSVLGQKFFFPPTPKNSLKVDRKEVGELALTDEPDRKISVFLTTPLIFLIKPFDRILSAREEKLGGRT